MHQITLKMARVINRMELEYVERKTGIGRDELKLVEADSRLLKYDDALKLQKIYKLPSLTMIFIGEEKDFLLTNHYSGLDLLEVYLDFLSDNRRQASYIMVWFEAVLSGLSPSEQELVRIVLEEVDQKYKLKSAELRRTNRYINYMARA